MSPVRLHHFHARFRRHGKESTRKKGERKNGKETEEEKEADETGPISAADSMTKNIF